jgi:hypothetical protein
MRGKRYKGGIRRERIARGGYGRRDGGRQARDIALQIQKTMAMLVGDPRGALCRHMIAGRFPVQTLARGVTGCEELNFQLLFQRFDLVGCPIRARR